jgi:hypothetical protein
MKYSTRDLGFISCCTPQWQFHLDDNSTPKPFHICLFISLFNCRMWKFNFFVLPSNTNTSVFEFNLGHIILNEKFNLFQKESLWDHMVSSISWCNQYTNIFFLVSSTCEDWISCYKIVETKMISWKIYMLVEFCFDVIGFNENKWKYINSLNFCYMDHH